MTQEPRTTKKQLAPVILLKVPEVFVLLEIRPDFGSKYFQMKYFYRLPLFVFLLYVLVIFIILAVRYPPGYPALYRDETEAGVLVRPQEETVLAEPAPWPCTGKEINLVVAVISAPQNYRARSVIR